MERPHLPTSTPKLVQHLGGRLLLQPDPHPLCWLFSHSQQRGAPSHSKGHVPVGQVSRAATAAYRVWIWQFWQVFGGFPVVFGEVPSCFLVNS